MLYGSQCVFVYYFQAFQFVALRRLIIVDLIIVD